MQETETQTLLSWKAVRRWLNGQAPMLDPIRLRLVFQVEPTHWVYGSTAVDMVWYLRKRIYRDHPDLSVTSGWTLEGLQRLLVRKDKLT